MVADPLLVLRMDDEAHRPADDLPPNEPITEAFISDLHVIAAVARRATRRLRRGLPLLPPIVSVPGMCAVRLEATSRPCTGSV